MLGASGAGTIFLSHVRLCGRSLSFNDMRSPYMFWGQLRVEAWDLGDRVIVPLKEIEYGFGYIIIIIRSPYTPQSIYLRGTIESRV